MAAPKKLRTMFGADDELQAFAEHWLSGPGCLSGASSLAHTDGAMVACLYRDSTFQVELCCVPPGFVIPDHVHPHADTIEVPVAGVLRLHVNGKDVYAGRCDERVQRLNRGSGIRINHTDVHGTAAPVGETGAMFLSIQKWLGCEPLSVLTDYLGRPLGEGHQEMLDAANL
ncbi:MAG: hypothetical protein JSS56_15945 [Proteobacteria bacterium]|nr:hypothetical protein [Pseudomonadota bacterium]